MWTYHPDLLSRPVPRYTSYPTAADFRSDVGAADYEAALADVTPGAALSAYVHIPFCKQICWYCGCNTAKANRTTRLEAYLRALYNEIELVAARLGGRGRLHRLAFGGGSPNALSAIQFARLVDRAFLAFRGDNAMVSVELDPRSFVEDWCRVIRAAGISHASLGVQTFNAEEQAAIGRVQPLELVATQTQRLRACGITSLNYDLMYGLPGQTLASLSATLEQAVSLQPDRIALFGYAHLPSMIPRQRKIDARALPGAQARFDMARAGHDQLVAAGYQAVGFDHFALPGDPLALAALDGRVRRNFQGFTDDQSDVLIGLGASAISQFPDLLVQNEKNAGAYRTLIDSGALAASRGIRRSADDRKRARMIEELLCSGATRLDLVGDADRRAIYAFLDRKLARVEDGWLRLSPDALPYARTLAAAFDQFRHTSAGQFSSAV